MLSTLSKRQCVFRLFKRFLETKLAWRQPIIVIECIFKNQNLCFASSGINQNLTSIKKQCKLRIITVFSLPTYVTI